MPIAKPQCKEKGTLLQVEFKEDENVAFSDEVRAFLLKNLSDPKEASPWSFSICLCIGPCHVAPLLLCSQGPSRQAFKCKLSDAGLLLSCTVQARIVPHMTVRATFCLVQ